MEDYIKSDLMGRGCPRHLNTSVFIAAVHYTHINTCYVLLLLLTVTLYTICPLQNNRTYYILLLLLAAHM